MTTTTATPLSPAEVVERDRQQRVASAEMYVRTRFYPPLPYQYGEYAVQAVEAVNSGEEDTEIMLDPDLPMHPSAAVFDESGSVHVTAAALIDALRLWHMVEDDEAHDCAEEAVECSGQVRPNGSFEIWTECMTCGTTWGHGSDSVL